MPMSCGPFQAAATERTDDGVVTALFNNGRGAIPDVFAERLPAWEGTSKRSGGAAQRLGWR